MKSKFLAHSILFSFFIFFLTSCGATSTGSRYSDKDTNNSDSEVNSKANDTKLVEDFDITPYKTEVEIPENHKQQTVGQSDIWYDYDSKNQEDQQKVLVGTEEGYRVLISNTDNLEDANQVKEEVLSSVNDNEVYIDFEPPFYKVKVGDFNDQKTADNLRFKLNQLDYTDAKVTKETINVFK